MACTEPRSAQIADLAAGRLEADSASDLLTHVEGCAACSQELDLVSDLLRAGPAAAPPVHALRPVPRRGVRVAALLALAAGLLLVFALWKGGDRPTDPRRLAQLEPPAAATLVLRSGEGEGDAQLASALERVAVRDWAAAEGELAAVVAARPDTALARFHLGLARLQLGQLEAALPELAAARALASDLLAEEALWYQAQALLALGRTDEARALLRELVELDGDLEPNARAQLAELDG
jgi:tetratricopeptide (TPR) repeat protein